MSQSMHCRPSALCGIADPLAAFYLDRATYLLGSSIEEDMKSASDRLPDKAKPAAHNRAQLRVLNNYLDIEESEHPERFRAPGKK